MSGGKNPTNNLGRKPKLKPKKNYFRWFKLAIISPKNLFAGFKKLSRNTKLTLVLATIIVALGSTAIIVTNRGNNNIKLSDIVDKTIIDLPESLNAHITKTTGIIQTKNDKGLWSDADKTLKITQGISIRTVGAVSRAEITLPDSSILRLDANTEVEFTALTEDRVEITQVSGYAYSRVIPSDTRQYIVVTKEAQYEAMGTAFMTIATPDEDAVEVYQSSVHETVTNQKPQQGEKLTVKSYIRPQDAGRIINLVIEEVKKNKFLIWNRDLDIRNDNFKNKLGFLSDIDSPIIDLTTPKDGDTVMLDSNATQGSTTFSGKTEIGATLTIRSRSVADSKPITINVNPDGLFTSSVITAPLGSSVFEFIAKDKAGNITTKNIRIAFQLNSQPVIADSIVLQVALSTDKTTVGASWVLSGATVAPDGVRIIWDTTSPPKSSSDTASFVDIPTTTTDYSEPIASFTSGETYYFIACSYDAIQDKCDTLTSDEITIVIPAP